MPASTLALINPTDEVAMRKWLVDEYIKWPKTPPATARVRKPVEIQAKTVKIIYGDDNHFAVRVYNPSTQGSCLRPALLMLHGGGWIHGFPEVEEGNEMAILRTLKSSAYH